MVYLFVPFGNAIATSVLANAMVVFIICYFIAGDDTLGVKNITVGDSKKVGAGLIMFYVLLAGAIGSIIYTEFSKISK